MAPREFLTITVAIFVLSMIEWFAPSHLVLLVCAILIATFAYFVPPKPKPKVTFVVYLLVNSLLALNWIYADRIWGNIRGQKFAALGLVLVVGTVWIFSRIRQRRNAAR